MGLDLPKTATTAAALGIKKRKDLKNLSGAWMLPDLFLRKMLWGFLEAAQKPQTPHNQPRNPHSLLHHKVIGKNSLPTYD